MREEDSDKIGRERAIDELAIALKKVFGDHALTVAERQVIADNESAGDWRAIAQWLRR